MAAICTLHVERSPGRLQYRVELPHRESSGPVRQVVSHPIRDEEVTALQASTKALLRGQAGQQFLGDAKAQGKLLYQTLVPEELRAELAAVTVPLLVSTSVSGLPFELLYSDEFWGLRYGLGKQILMDRLPRSRVVPRPDRPHRQIPRALIIVSDPRGDLKFVHDEGERLFAELKRVADVWVLGEEVTFERVATKLGEGFDVIHYCGHVVRGTADTSGLLLADGRILSGEVIERVLVGAPLVFINGCASSRNGLPAADGDWEEDIRSITYGFILGGARAVVGTACDITDADATTVAVDFYRNALDHQPLGEALRLARRHGRSVAPHSPTWLSFVLYGNPAQVLVDAGTTSTSVPSLLDSDRPSIEALRKNPVRAPSRAWYRLAAGLVGLMVLVFGASLMGYLDRAHEQLQVKLRFASALDTTSPRTCRGEMTDARVGDPVWICVSWFGLTPQQRYQQIWEVRDSTGRMEGRWHEAIDSTGTTYHSAYEFETARLKPDAYSVAIYLDDQKFAEERLQLKESPLVATEQLIREIPRGPLPEQGTYGMHSSCNLPPAAPGEIVVLFGTSGGQALSTTTIAGQDEETKTARIVVEPGAEPLYLILSSLAATIWRFEGDISRLARVALLGVRSQGVVGLDRARVINLAEEVSVTTDAPCFAPFYEVRSVEGVRARGVVERAVGRWPDVFAGSDSVETVRMPSAAVSIAEHSLFVPGLDEVGLGLSRFNPAGVIDIDPSSVVSASRPERYEVLPGYVGLAQLLASGAIEMTGRDYYIKKPISRFPAGLAGAQSVRFILGKGVPMPAGSPGHSCVVSEDTGEELGNLRLCDFR